ncbi:hypothetical protein F511_40029 [Dorcoceras hygrometricum]|uniref:Uncharacterized protein n=1 Tax=Dorcoceras hygrometricum TaxID=472368 RepID=A0A2Z7DBJ2_9LAMI|nr:hypothetical protein F511_40029 [Dorcoceras hygrometricum]
MNEKKKRDFSEVAAEKRRKKKYEAEGTVNKRKVVVSQVLTEDRSKDAERPLDTGATERVPGKGCRTTKQRLRLLPSDSKCNDQII